ncbi:MAG: twin arginine-targeting protein translocase TatC [Anaerolinea sp. 4484_236]|nr:MAG: twin arginine-targeting protein translocase TatC [Anaerolinea sp. 4484_236]OQY31949.1 MAG: twin arginine-targeting protein translocase TatC [Anaerolineaceae bacterium 4572_5.2]RLD10103.1 MAG: twin-arginine translocase subunit TatC [Chloroflexota bacterium]
MPPKVHTRFQAIKDFFKKDPKNTPVGEVISTAWDSPKDLIPHLNALRKHILRATIILILGVILSLTFSRQLLDWLTVPVGGIKLLEAIEVTEPMSVVMRVALLTGFTITLPYITLEIWLFIAPGLKIKPRLWGLVFIPLATILFAGGMAFAYFVMIPAALPFLLNFMGIQTTPRPASYIRFITGLMFWIGATFEFPLIIFVIAKLGWIKAKTLASQWRIAIIIISIFAAVITPTVDPINMLLVMGPMIVLYLFSTLLAYLAQS